MHLSGKLPRLATLHHKALLASFVTFSILLLLIAAGCGRDAAQTAYPPKPSAPWYTFVQLETPKALGLEYEWVDVAIAWPMGCAVSSSGGLYCAGFNSYKVFGDRRSSFKTAEMELVDEGPFTQVFGGAGSVCALTAEGKPHCFGEPAPISEWDLEALLAASTSWRRLFLGYTSGCGLTTDGRLYCTENCADQRSCVDEPIVEIPGEWSLVAFNLKGLICALSRKGAASCHHNLASFRKGIPESGIELAGNWSTVTVGSDYVCALSSADASLWCWKILTNGGLGKALHSDTKPWGSVLMQGLSFCGFREGESLYYCLNAEILGAPFETLDDVIQDPDRHHHSGYAPWVKADLAGGSFFYIDQAKALYVSGNFIEEKR